MIATPYYYIDEIELSKNIEGFKEALDKYFPHNVMGYSFKTNSLPWIIRHVKKNNMQAEVVSSDEYNLAKYIGFDINNIIYNGPMKTEETFLEAIQGGAIVNIETYREIGWLHKLPSDRKFSIGLRVNFDIEKYCPNESACGQEGGRFGFCYENGALEEVLDELKKYKNIKVNGLHMHVSSKTRSLNIYHTIARICCIIKCKYNLNLDYIDVGGGFFGGVPSKPSYMGYIGCIYDVLKEEFNTEILQLIIEPGASIIASPIHFVTSVIDVKKTNRNIFITTDGSRNDIDPLMSKNSYLYEVRRNCSINKQVIQEQIVSGYTCMEHDRFFNLKNHHLLEVGDQIIFHKVGSYTMCLSPLFIKYFPDVYVKNGDNYRKIRQKWSEEEYVQGEIKYE